MDLITVLNGIKPPKSGMEMDPALLYDAKEACPAIQMLTGQKLDSWSEGLITGLVTIHASLSDMGYAEVMAEISYDHVRAVDGVLAEKGEQIIKDLPELDGYMQEGDSFAAGVICAFASVLLAKKLDTPTTLEEAPVTKDLSALLSENEDAEPAPLQMIGGGTDLSEICLALNNAGLGLESMQILPKVSNDNITMSISGPLGDSPPFSMIARINAIFKTAGAAGDIAVWAKDDEVWYSYEL